jgi:hypothetical protein
MSVFGAIVGSVTDIRGETTRGTASLQKRRAHINRNNRSAINSASPTQLGPLETTTQTRGSAFAINGNDERIGIDDLAATNHRRAVRLSSVHYPFRTYR